MTRMNPRLLLAAGFLIAACPGAVPAASPTGFSLLAQDGAIVADGAGGTLHVWEETRRGRSGVYAQRLDAAGVPQWPDTGVAVSPTAGNQVEPVVAPDGAGGAIVAWADSRSGGYWHIYAQRIEAAGAPQWGAGGAAICTASAYQGSPAIVSDGAGGAVIAWQDWRTGITAYIYAQRVGATGAPLWTGNGVAVSTVSGSSWYPEVAADGSGGAIVTWQDWRNGNYDVFARRVDGAGSALWTAGGVAVCAAPGDQVRPRLVADGAGGAVIAWEDARAASHDIYAQHVAGNGALGWTANGVALCAAAGHQLEPALAPDGAGGAVVAWQDQRGGGNDIYAQRVTSAGATPWLAGGVIVCAAAQNQLAPTVAAHGPGGSVVSWEDYRGSAGTADVYAQRLDAAGTPQWTADGVALGSAAGTQSRPAAISDGSGVVVAWEDARAAESEPDLYARRVAADGTLAWAANGAAIYVFPGLQIEPICIPSGDGGVILVWREKRGGEYDICARGFSSEGLALWPTAVLCGAPGQQSAVVAIPDGDGGAIAAWTDARSGEADPDVYAQRVSAAGALLWGADGLAVGAAGGAQGGAALVPDGAGGAIVVWQDGSGADFDIRAQRVTAGGALAWGAGGVALCAVSGDQSLVSLAPAGAGGAIVAWQDARATTTVYVQRVDAGGAVQWDANGEPVCAGTGTPMFPAIASDGTDGAIIAWLGACSSSSPGGLYSQRLDPAGAHQWPEGGVYVGAARGQAVLVSDGLGGGLFAWSERERGCIEHCPSDIYAQRADGLGTLLWRPGGAPVCTLAADQYDPQLVADGAGGVIIAWTDIRAGYALPNFFVQRLDASGATLWAANGVPVSTLALPRYAPSLAPDGAGGAFVAWQEKRDGYRWLAYWQSLDQQGTPRSAEGHPIGGVVGVKDGPSRPGVRLALTNPRPNPARGAFTVSFVLPVAAPATLELFDVRGRRVVTHSLTGLGAGEHSVRLDAGARLAPGVYVVRLTQGGKAATRKACVLE